jgi:2-aminobenzoate-CoA ligase
VIGFDGTANHDAELDRVALDKPVRFDAVETGQDDVALLGFTSGTTGEPKATLHFHRDLLIIADGYAKEVLGVTPEDVFVGSPPLAFTFGLGGLAIFPLRFGAAAALLETASPPNLIEIIETYKATVCLHRADRLSGHAARHGRGRGPFQPARRRLGRRNAARAGLRGVDGKNRQADARRHRRNRDAAYLHHQPLRRFPPACTGKPVTGYEARIVDEEMNEMPRGEVGRLAVRGPTGCRYLATSARRTMCRTAGTSPATRSGRTRTAISISPRATTT